MLQKSYDEQLLVKAAKAYIKKYAGIDEEPREVLIDNFSILLDYDDYDGDKDWPNVDLDFDGVDAYAPAGKNKEFAYIELLNLDKLLAWFHSFS